MLFYGGSSMIDIKGNLLESLIEQAKEMAIRKDKAQFLSLTEKIAPVHLLSFFDYIKKFEYDRTFWSDVENDFYLIGLGNIKQIKAYDNRYDELKLKWESFTKEALIHDECKQYGTGLIALGGMTFDPLKEKTALWEKFPTSELIVPEFIISRYKTNYYLTINRYVQAVDCFDKVVNDIKAKKEKLLNYTLVTNDSTHEIVKKEELKRDE